MTKPDLGLPSGIKDSTYQQNREKEIVRLREELKQLKEEIKIRMAVLDKLNGG